MPPSSDGKSGVPNTRSHKTLAVLVPRRDVSAPNVPPDREIQALLTQTVESRTISPLSWPCPLATPAKTT